jgi:hypothetical protein
MRPGRLLDAALAAAFFAGGSLSMPGGAARAQDPGPPGGGGAIRISPEPPRLLLGRDLAAELRIAAPADVEDLSLSASVGRIDGLRRLPGGGFSARWRAPAERHPQVAIVAALGRTPHGAEHGWVAIPLSGQGDARVRATPGQEITIQIGGRKFGPRRAGNDGLAVIPVVVPPGVREAHHGFTPIDLHVPETQLLHAVSDRGVVFADRQERVRVFAYVVAPHGAARRGDVPVFEASRGTVSVAEREPGLMEAVWTLPPGHAGEERLAVRLAAAPASRAVLKLETVAGPPAGVALAFDRAALVAGEEAVTVTARAVDAAGNPVPAALSLAAEGGELAEVRDREPGEIEARVRAGPYFGGRSEVRVTASAAGIGLSGSRALPLKPGEPAVARFEAGDRVLRGDGARVEVLRMAVADRHGNPVDVTPAVTAERGKVVGISVGAPGAFDVRYVAPAVTVATRERLAATIGGVSATASPLLLAPAPGLDLAWAAGAALDLRGRFSGPRAGVAIERPVGAATARGLDLAWRGEVDGLRLDAAGKVALLGGLGLSRALDPSAVLRASATAGALFGAGGASLATRLSVGVGVPGRTLKPFVEVALLAARDGAPGPFAAIGITAGMRLALERRHGDDPHRR